MTHRLMNNIPKYIGQDFCLLVNQVFALLSNDNENASAITNAIGTQLGGILRDTIGLENDQVLEDMKKLD